MIIRDNFVKSAENISVTLHLNHLNETVQMSVTRYGFDEK